MEGVAAGAPGRQEPFQPSAPGSRTSSTLFQICLELGNRLELGRVAELDWASVNTADGRGHGVGLLGLLVARVWAARALACSRLFSLS
jgi:hypothetical protein